MSENMNETMNENEGVTVTLNLENIEDDDEYDAAADKFDEWMDSLEFDEIDLDAE